MHDCGEIHREGMKEGAYEESKGLDKEMKDGEKQRKKKISKEPASEEFSVGVGAERTVRGKRERFGLKTT